MHCDAREMVSLLHFYGLGFVQLMMKSTPTWRDNHSFVWKMLHHKSSNLIFDAPRKAPWDQKHVATMKRLSFRLHCTIKRFILLRTPMSSHPSSLCCSVSSQQIHHLPCRYCIFSPRRWGPWSKRKEIPQRFTPPRGTSDQSCLVKLWQVVFIMIRKKKCDELGYNNGPMIKFNVKFCGAKIGTLILIRKACGGIFLVRPESVSDWNIPWSNGSILDIWGWLLEKKQWSSSIILI